VPKRGGTQFETHHVHPKLAEHVRTRLGYVAANHHHTIDAPLGDVAQHLGLAALLTEVPGPSAPPGWGRSVAPESADYMARGWEGLSDAGQVPQINLTKVDT
jgi:hypothetical protein